MTARGSQTLTWDVENRLTAVSGGASFVYDGDGNRVKKTEGGVTTVYVNKYYEKTGTEVTTSYYLGSKLVAQRKGTTLSYVMQDHLGSTSVTANSSGASTGTIRYFSFGETRSTTGTLTTDKKFTGQRLDATGLYYYGARYYDATIGRFISADTYIPWSIGYDGVNASLVVNVIPSMSLYFPGFTSQAPVNSQNLNRYTYVLDNPLKYTDPNGWWTVGVGIAGNAYFAWGVSGCIMIVFDGHGNWGVFVSGGAGGYAGIGVSGGIQIQFTNADNIFQLEGISVQTGGSIGDVVSASLEFVGGNGYIGGQITVGAGTPGIEMHGVAEIGKLIFSGTIPGLENSSVPMPAGYLASAAGKKTWGQYVTGVNRDGFMQLILDAVAQNCGPN
jgi:RHS repeat-associated protein